jgi:hypothetical protein
MNYLSTSTSKNTRDDRNRTVLYLSKIQTYKNLTAIVGIYTCVNERNVNRRTKH